MVSHFVLRTTSSYPSPRLPKPSRFGLGEEGQHPPENPALENLAKAIALSHKDYTKRHRCEEGSTVVLFIVQEGETNTGDQKMLEHRIFEEHGVAVERRSLQQVSECMTRDNETGRLYLDGESEVTTVYFRAGYAPSDYEVATERAWAARR